MSTTLLLGSQKITASDSASWATSCLTRARILVVSWCSHRHFTFPEWVHVGEMCSEGKKSYIWDTRASVGSVHIGPAWPRADIFVVYIHFATHAQKSNECFAWRSRLFPGSSQHITQFSNTLCESRRNVLIPHRRGIIPLKCMHVYVVQVTPEFLAFIFCWIRVIFELQSLGVYGVGFVMIWHFMGENQSYIAQCSWGCRNGSQKCVRWQDNMLKWYEKMNWQHHRKRHSYGSIACTSCADELRGYIAPRYVADTIKWVSPNLWEHRQEAVLKNSKDCKGSGGSKKCSWAVACKIWLDQL